MKTPQWIGLSVVFVAMVTLCCCAQRRLFGTGFNADAISLQGIPLAPPSPLASPTTGALPQTFCITQSGAGFAISPCPALSNCSPNALVGSTNAGGNCLPFSLNTNITGNPNGNLQCLRAGDTAFATDTSLHWDCTAAGSKLTAVWQQVAAAATASPSPTPTPTLTPTPTATPTAGPGSSVNPSQTSPIDPTQTPYNCDSLGVIDATSCLNSAIQAGDVLVPNGTYKVVGEISIPSNRSFQCANRNTVTINNPNGQNAQVNTFLFRSVNHSSLANCTVAGTNTTVPPAYSANFLYNWLVRIDEDNSPGTGAQNVNNIWVVNNVFKGAWGQSTVQTYANSSQGVPTAIHIDSNDFSSCGYYGPVFDSTINSSMDKNTVANCSIGEEPDVCTGQQSNNNTHNGNVITMGLGSGCAQAGRVGCGTGIKDFLGMFAGYDSCFPFTPNNVYNNNVVHGADIYTSIGSPKPTQSGNTCDLGCVNHP